MVSMELTKIFKHIFLNIEDLIRHIFLNIEDLILIPREKLNIKCEVFYNE